MQDGKTALMYAAAGGHIEVVRELLSHQTDFNADA
jgi:ankyrin repeat protein